MRNLIKIGILLLFAIGLCIVQPGFSTPVLVDNDVGTEYIQKTDVLTDVVITNEFEVLINPGISVQVATPLKYFGSCLLGKYTNYFIQNVAICSSTAIMYDEYTPCWVSFKPQTSPRDRFLNISGQTVLTKGLDRVAIGERLQKNLM